MKIRALVFDLDGTLIDGYEAIHDALNHAVTQLGFPAFTLMQTREMVGHGLENLMEESVGKKLAPKAVELFRNFYPSVVLKKTRLLAGVPELIEQLARSNYKMSLASNKPAQFSKMILETNHIAHHFQALAGPDPFPAKPDPAMLFSLMKTMGSSPEETACVGDMEVDVQFARNAGCPVIVVPSGSRDLAYLKSSGADLVIATLAELPGALERLH